MSEQASVCDTSLFIANLYTQHYVRDAAGDAAEKYYNACRNFNSHCTLIQNSLINFQASISTYDVVLVQQRTPMYTYKLHLYI